MYECVSVCEGVWNRPETMPYPHPQHRAPTHEKKKEEKKKL